MWGWSPLSAPRRILQYVDPRKERGPEPEVTVRPTAEAREEARTRREVTTRRPSRADRRRVPQRRCKGKGDYVERWRIEDWEALG
jgi:hypothetical protein